jgi:predicted Ser/Thr protein kinase
MDYADRQKQPVVLTPGLARDLWKAVKDARDEAADTARRAAAQEARMNDLLARLKDNGGADHLPTLDEVQRAWRGEQQG